MRIYLAAALLAIVSTLLLQHWAGMLVGVGCAAWWATGGRRG